MPGSTRRTSGGLDRAAWLAAATDGGQKRHEDRSEPPTRGIVVHPDGEEEDPVDEPDRRVAPT